MAYFCLFFNGPFSKKKKRVIQLLLHEFSHAEAVIMKLIYDHHYQLLGWPLRRGLIQDFLRGGGGGVGGRNISSVACGGKGRARRKVFRFKMHIKRSREAFSQATNDQ